MTSNTDNTYKTLTKRELAEAVTACETLLDLGIDNQAVIAIKNTAQAELDTRPFGSGVNGL